MKFGQEFKTALRNSDFPPEWTASAISYSQLKKCINRLSDELKQVGLDPKTLNKLLRHVDEYNATADAEDKFRPFEYILSAGSTSRTFEPKLLFCIDDATGALHRAQLDTETKDKLQMLAAATGISELSVFEDGDHECDAHGDAPEASTDPQTTMTSAITNDSSRSGHRTIAVPLTSDVEFFTKLTTELSGLETLQEKENRRMNTEIHDLARQITHVTDPDRKANKKLLTVWRQIFQLYVEEDIFFGQTERDHSARNAQEATARFQHFTEKVDKAGLVGSIKKKESQAALNMFFHINRELLQALRFGEINTTAMTKILKSESSPSFRYSPSHHTNLAPTRVRQTHRPRRQINPPAIILPHNHNTSPKLPTVQPGPRQSRMCSCFHSNSLPHPEKGGLHMSNVLRDQMAPC
jgi:E3 ubiquitin-protein ligase BAH